MGKRIYEIAKEKGVTNKEIMWIMEKLNIEVKSHMSVLNDDNLDKLEDYYKELKEKAHKEEEEKRTQEEKKKKPVKEKPEEKKQEVIEEIIVKKQPEKHSDVKSKDVSANIKKKPDHKKPEVKKQNNKAPLHKSNRMVTDNTEERWKGKKKFKNKNKSAAPKPEVNVKKIILGEEVQVKDLAMRLNKGSAEIIKKLMGLGIMATLNQYIDFDTASLIANEFGIEDIEFKTLKRQTELNTIEDDPKTLKSRPPIITVMGHVDHGKTSLLDAIRKTNVIATEAGGITQHIGAYQVNYHGKKITFIDTPGHAAFTSMRARGAQITDISILVVAADDGVMPQTIEAINHSKAAKVPIIVAVNKIDKEGADPNRVMQQLTEYGLIPEEWGGDTIFVPISAKKGDNIDGLLEMIQLVAEVEDLKANPNRLAEGFVLEGRLDKEKGTITSLLVTKGTLKIGDMILAGESYGKVRAMLNDSGKNIKSAGPATPVEILGISTVPEAGDVFQAVKDEKLASYLADQRKIVRKEEKLKKNQTVSLENLFEKISEGNLKDLNLIVKGDVHGSVEALCQSIRSIQTDEVKVNILHEGVGAINETDVKLAMTSNALIIGFNVRPDSNSKRLAAEEDVNITLYRVIYEVIDDIKKAISGLLSPDIKEVEQGTLEVRQVIKVPKVGLIAGCYVTDGKITSGSKVRVIRDGIIVHDGSIDSLKRFKDEVKEVAQGYECGLSLVDFNDIKEGDVIESYTLESIARKLD